VSETVGIEFVSREGFNNNNDAARCRNEFCLTGGGAPQSAVGKNVTVKAPNFNKGQ
jgi:hypothetical protein